MPQYESHKLAVKAFIKRKVDAGICIRCPRPAAPNRQQCAECLKKRTAENRARYFAKLEHSREMARRSQRKLYYANHEQSKAAARERYAQNPELVRKYELWQHYRLTLEQYNKMVIAQGGLCALCGKPPMVGKRARGHEKRAPRLCVDHDHATGKVRGLLCHWCNSHIIAGIEKSDASLDRIAAYLRR